jgi:hypothetical protein
MIQPATAPMHPHWSVPSAGKNANVPQASSRAWPFMARQPVKESTGQHKQPSWQDTGS